MAIHMTGRNGGIGGAGALTAVLAAGLVLAAFAAAALASGKTAGLAVGAAAALHLVLLARALLRPSATPSAATAILLATVVYGAGALALHSRFAAFPGSGLVGLAILHVTVLTAARQWRTLRKAPPSAMIGLAVTFAYAMIAALAPLLAPYPEAAIVGSEYEPWGADFVLGTDNLGRDMLSRLIFATRNTISIAAVATALGFAAGAAAGLLAATIGGWIDTAMGRVVDILMAIPQLIFALLILTIVGTSITSLVLVIAVVDATRVFRLVRAVSMNVLALEFVEAARLRGEGLLWIIRREVLPNITAPLIVEFGIRFCFVFLFISSLSFLGLGIQPPTADWGSMVRENAALIVYGDITPLLPAGAIAVLAVAINLAVDWFLHTSSGLKE